MHSDHGIVIGAGPGTGKSIALLTARHGLMVTLVGYRSAALEGLGAEVAETVGDHAGSVGGSDAFAPDRVAAALWVMGDGGEVERACTSAA